MFPKCFVRVHFILLLRKTRRLPVSKHFGLLGKYIVRALSHKVRNVVNANDYFTNVSPDDALLFIWIFVFNIYVSFEIGFNKLKRRNAQFGFCLHCIPKMALSM